MLRKNVANQKLAVFAYDKNTGEPKTADAANVTAQISKDGGSSAATNDTNPTELDATNHPGIYIFDLSQAETNADLVIVTVKSTTAYVVLDPVIVAPRLEQAIASDIAAVAANAELAAAAAGAGRIDYNYVSRRKKVYAADKVTKLAEREVQSIESGQGVREEPV